MLYLLFGYLFLFIFRPYEYYPFMGDLHIERIYMMIFIIALFAFGKPRFRPHPILFTVLLFVSAMGISSAFAVDKTTAFEATLNYLKIVIFFAMITLIVRDEDDVRRFVVAYLFIMFLYMGKSAWEFFVNDRYWWRMGIKRMMGIDISFADPNYFAASIVYSLPFAYAVYSKGTKGFLGKTSILSYALLGTVCIIYSGSRSGMVTALLFLLLVVFASGRKIAGLLLLSASLVFLWMTIPEEYKVRFLSIFVSGIAPSGADASAHGRIVGLLHGVDIFRQHPFLGVGPDNFRYSWGPGTSGPNAHNLYGQLLGELGLLGTAVFFGMVVFIVAAHRRVLKMIRSAATPETRSNAENAAAGATALRDPTLTAAFSTAGIQAIILLIFNGNFGHNLYRYNWLWIGALGICAAYLVGGHERGGADAGREN